MDTGWVVGRRPIKTAEIEGRAPCHREDTYSLRRTKAGMVYKATGNLRAIQILLGHTKIENTVRHLGVDVEHALLLAERAEI